MNQPEYAAKMLSFYDGDNHVENVRRVPEMENIIRSQYPTLVTAFLAMDQERRERKYYMLYTQDETKKDRYIGITFYSDGTLDVETVKGVEVKGVDAIADQLKELIVDYLIHLPEYRLLHTTGLLHVEK